MNRRIWTLCAVLLAVGAVEFAALAGASTHLRLPDGATSANAGALATPTSTATPTTPAPTRDAMPATPTASPTEGPPAAPVPANGFAGAASISGTIVNAENTPITGATVWASPDGCCASSVSTTTEAGGGYTILGLAGGAWRVYAEAPGYPSRFYMDVYNYSDATLVTTAGGANTPGINIKLLAEGHISGVVTNALGTPIADVSVSASVNPCCGSYGYASTAGNGAYQIDDIPPGDYTVYAYKSGYAGEYFNNTYDWSLTTDVAVTPGATTAAISFALAAGSHITGHVLDAAATPISGAYVSAQSDCCGGSGTYTNPDGSYAIDDLPAASYRVQVYATGFVSEYYDNATAYNDADLVAVGTAATVGNIDFALGTGGTISGKVIDGNGAPISGASVYADQNSCCGYGSTTTALDGTYTIAALAPGTYRVYAVHAGFATEYYDNAYFYTDAEPVTVQNDADTGSIDFQLGAGATISGVVRDSEGQPLENASVGFAGLPCCAFYSAYTDELGQYSRTDFPPGTWLAYASRDGFVTEWFANATTSDTATHIVLGAGDSNAAVDFSLTPGSVIAGTVTDGNGAPLGSVFVSASTTAGCCNNGYDVTAADGTYSINTLRAGSFRVYADADDYIREYYDNVTDYDAATLVVLGTAATANGIDFSLTQGAHITGVVTDGNGAQLENAYVYATAIDNCCDGGTYGYAYTNALGAYDISALLPGSFRVRAERDGYIGEYYDNAQEYDAATPVVVASTATTPGIDFSLEIGAHITGFVKDALDQPIADASITANDGVCCSGGHFGYAYTDANGFYDIDSLVGGSFTVYANQSGFAAEYYDNVYDPALATPVIVAAGATASNIDFALDAGATITGFVRDEAALPIAGAQVEARPVSGGGTWYGIAGSDGAYIIDDLPPGDYRVVAFEWFASYVPEYYNNAETPGAATPVHVNAGGLAASINFSLRPPNPDKWRETIEFFQVPFTGNVNTAGFGIEAGEYQACGGIGATAWYKHWVQSYPTLLPIDAPPAQVSFPQNSVTMQVDTFGSNFDTVIAVYDDQNPSPPADPSGAPQLLGCNDDAPGGSQTVGGGALAAGQSKITWTAIPGHTYIIQAGGKNGATGNLTLHVGCPGDADCDAVANIGDNCASVWNYDQRNTDNQEIVTPGVAVHDTSIANSDNLGDACDPDGDNDGLSDDDEDGDGAVSPPGACATASSMTNHLDSDSDDDGALDGAECALGSNPHDPVSKPAFGVPDNDGDSLSNAFEGIIGSNPDNKDTDADGILDGIEYKGYNTSLTVADTDGDGCSDAREIASVDANPGVNSIDLLLVAKNFLLPGKRALDINKDGFINSLDLQLVAKNFAPGAC